jgi:hypothetical protein
MRWFPGVQQGSLLPHGMFAMNKRFAIAACFLACLYGSFAGAQTAALPDLDTADWSAKQAQSLNAQSKQAVWKFLNNLWTGNQNFANEGKLCSFEFADLRHSGELSLAVTYDNGGTGDCNDFDIFDKTPAGIEDYDFGADPVFDGIEDIDGDGRHEVVVGRSFASIGRDHCAAFWPVIYAWDGSGYADVSGQFKGFYRQRLQELTLQLAPSPTPTPAGEQAAVNAQGAVSAQIQTVESLPSEGPGPVRRFIIRPQTAAPSESESTQEASDMGDRDCLKAEPAKIERFLGISTDAGMLDAIKWKNSNNPYDREFAASVLADIGTAEAIGDLRTLSRDPDPDVAATAKAAMEPPWNPCVYPTIQGELLTKGTGAPSAK